uniref:17S U2 SnRNP complex component HTATSF1 n=1 Tax=Parastrongyloides trichosuri TaxID=131310 RepID=A0A0N4Z2K8_PARTI
MDEKERIEKEGGTSTTTNEEEKKTSNVEQKFLDNRWVAWNRGDKFMEYVDNEWRTITDERIKSSLKVRWDPTIDDEFLAMYKMNYGTEGEVEEKVSQSEAIKMYMKEKGRASGDCDSDEEKGDKKVDEKGNDEKSKKNKNGKRPSGWIDFEEDKNTTVYVQGLPLDMTEEKFVELFSKCGVIQNDPRTNKPKIKLYRNEDGSLKGDGTCRYIKRESIFLALQILDGMKVDDDCELKVEEAKFQMKGEFDPKKKKRGLTAQEKKKFLERQNKIFEFKPDLPVNYRPKSDCVVILKNAFDINELIKDASLLFDIKESATELFSKYGTVKKVIVYENNRDGVISGKFTNTEESDLAVKHLNGSLFRGRVLVADYWDGRTKYAVSEDEEQIKERMKNWEQYLQDNKDDGNKTDEEINSREGTPDE